MLGGSDGLGFGFLLFEFFILGLDTLQFCLQFGLLPLGFDSLPFGFGILSFLLELSRFAFFFEPPLFSFVTFSFLHFTYMLLTFGLLLLLLCLLSFLPLTHRFLCFLLLYGDALGFSGLLLCSGLFSCLEV